VQITRERAARAARMAEIDRLRRPDVKEQVKMTSPWKQARMHWHGP